MALNDPGEKKSKQFLILGIAAFIIILIWAIYTNGALGFKAVLSMMVKTLIWLAIILGIVFAIYKIFFEKGEVNLIANDKQSIIDAGKLCKPPLLRDIFLTGDHEHGEAKLGHIIGYCQIQSYQDAAKGIAIPEDCFIFKTQVFPFSLFEESKVIRCLPHEHTDLVGDVKIYAISPIEKYGYFWPNHTFLNVRRIDQSVVKEAYRGQIHEVMTDLVSITKKSAGLDSEQNKMIDQRKLLKIPSSLDETESRG